MKAITPIIGVILLILITISIVGVAFVFFSGLTTTVSEEAEGALEQQRTMIGAPFEIINVDKNQVLLRNSGTSTLSNPRFYVNNVEVGSSGPSIDSGKFGTFTLNDSQLAMLPDPAPLRVEAAGFSQEETVDFYSQHTVAYWKFDEGSGDTAYDSAANNDAAFDSQRLAIDEAVTGWFGYEPSSVALETTNKKQGNAALRLSEPTSSYRQIGSYTGTLDVSAWEQADNTLTGKLHYWVYINDITLSYPTQVEFGNENNYFQAYWLTPLPVSGSWQTGWNLVELDFEQADYKDLGSIDWTQVDWFEFYLNTNTSTSNYFIFDDFRINNKTTPVWTDGKYGAALRFDGIDDYVSYPAPSFSATDNRTISLWFKLNNDGYHSPFSNPLIETDYVRLYVRMSENTVRLRTDDVSSRESPYKLLGSGDRNWHYAVGIFEYDGTNQHLTLYVDGTLIGEGSYATIPTAAYEKSIGRIVSGYFNGTIDEIRILDVARPTG
jgi:flagellin-like protein